jgi:hypothetical protein
LIHTLTPDAKELAMGAAFGTNNPGMGLRVVLSEVDGTRAPLPYCFVKIFKENGEGELVGMSEKCIPGTIPG